MATRDWNATSYDALPLPHVEWGRRTLDRLRPRAGERVLDAGCGTGRDAAELLSRHPDVTLVGIDGSRSMIDQATARLAEHADRVTLRVGDLTEPVDVSPHDAVDAVVSVACFHWIADHRRLFANLADVLAPGGRLVSDCGGDGNIAGVTRAVAEVTGEPYRGTSFAGVDDTRADLAATGFVDVTVTLRPHPVRIDDPAVLEEYLATVCLGAHLAELPADRHAEFAGAVRRAMTAPVLDYQRLEIDARRPG